MTTANGSEGGGGGGSSRKRFALSLYVPGRKHVKAFDDNGVEVLEEYVQIS